MWTCSKCNTAEIDDADVFCFCCGQPNEVPYKSVAAANPASLSIQPVVQAQSNNTYDGSVFASQFPQWDLQPPAVMVRRVRRSI